MRKQLTRTAAPSNKIGSVKTEVSAVSEPLGVVAKMARAFASSFSLAKIATSMKSEMWVALRSPVPERSQSSSKKEVPAHIHSLLGLTTYHRIGTHDASVCQAQSTG